MCNRMDEIKIHTIRALVFNCNEQFIRKILLSHKFVTSIKIEFFRPIIGWNKYNFLVFAFYLLSSSMKYDYIETERKNAVNCVVYISSVRTEKRKKYFEKHGLRLSLLSLCVKYYFHFKIQCISLHAHSFNYIGLYYFTF